jgi:chromosome segregation ATPase
MRTPDARRRRIVVTAAGLMMLLAGAVPLMAQQSPDARDRADRTRLEERIRARIGQIMRERLELDSAEEATLSATVREFEGRRRELSATEREARRRIDELLEGQVPESEAEALLSRIVEVRAAEAELFREEQARLVEVLGPARVLEFYELRREIGQRIRAIRERRRGDDEPGRRGPGGGVEEGVAPGGAHLER